MIFFFFFLLLLLVSFLWYFMCLVICAERNIIYERLHHNICVCIYSADRECNVGSAKTNASGRRTPLGTQNSLKSFSVVFTSTRVFFFFFFFLYSFICEWSIWLDLRMQRRRRRRRRKASHIYTYICVCVQNSSEGSMHGRLADHEISYILYSR